MPTLKSRALQSSLERFTCQVSLLLKELLERGMVSVIARNIHKICHLISLGNRRQLKTEALLSGRLLFGLVIARHIFILTHKGDDTMSSSLPTEMTVRNFLTKALEKRAVKVQTEWSYSTPIGRLVPDMRLLNGAEYVVETKLASESKLLEAMVQLYDFQVH